MTHVLNCRFLALLLSSALVCTVQAKGPFLLVSGRWDNTVVVIDVEKR